MINHRSAHDESAFGFVTAANILENKNVAAGRKFGLAGVDGLRRVSVHAIGSALHEEGQRRGVIFGAQNDGVEFDAVAHGYHDLLARVLRLAELKRLIADLTGVVDPFRASSLFPALLDNAVEADDFSF